MANSFFFLIQATCLQGFSGKIEFANRGKLSGKLAKSFWQPPAILGAKVVRELEVRPAVKDDKRQF